MKNVLPSEIIARSDQAREQCEPADVVPILEPGRSCYLLRMSDFQVDAFAWVFSHRPIRIWYNEWKPTIPVNVPRWRDVFLFELLPIRLTLEALGANVKNHVHVLDDKVSVINLGDDSPPRMTLGFQPPPDDRPPVPMNPRKRLWPPPERTRTMTAWKESR